MGVMIMTLTEDVLYEGRRRDPPMTSTVFSYFTEKGQLPMIFGSFRGSRRARSDE